MEDWFDDGSLIASNENQEKNFSKPLCLNDILKVSGNGSLSERNGTCGNETVNTETQGDEMNLFLNLMWTFLYSSMLIVAIAGNAIVMWIVTAHRRMWNVTNSFIVNLSIADLLNSVFNCIFSFIFMKSKNWVFGEAFCIMNHFFSYSTVSASAFTLSAISFDRHISILRPNKPYLSSTTALMIHIAVWFFSILLAIPPLIYTGLHTVTKSGETIRLCVTVWPDGPPAISFYDYAYNIIFTVITYVIPMIQMLISYSHMSVVLWSSKNFDSPQNSPRSVDDIQLSNGTFHHCTRRNTYVQQQAERAILNKRKLVKMFVTVVVIFGICWFPYHGYFLYTYHDKDIVTNPAIQHVYLVFYWLAMANSMINPIIYYFMNARFRFYFRSLVMKIRSSLLTKFVPVDVSTSFELDVYPPALRNAHSEPVPGQQQQDLMKQIIIRQQNHN